MPGQRKLLVCALALLSLGAPMARAQAPGGAIAEARARLACGGGVVVSAEYIPGNLIRVQCQQQSDELPPELQGTTLTPQLGVAGVVTTVLIGVLTGSDDPETTTTTTTTGR